MTEAQEKVRSFLTERRLALTPATRLLDLSSELGELGKEYLKATAYGAQPFTATSAWSEELGDALFSLLALAVETGIDSAVVLEGALAKYRARCAATNTPGSGQ